jgi:hypothetical protein
VAGSRAGATDAVVEGFTRALQRARRAGSPPGSFRIAVVRATRQAAVHRAPATAPELTVAAPNTLAASFRDLPERWRSVLWLTTVEGGTPAQAADVLALEPDAAAALAARATAGLRERFLDQERRVAADDCRSAIDALAIDPHVETCTECRHRAALVANPRAALSPLVGAMPAGLLTSVNTRFDRWRASEIERERRRLAWVGPVAPWAEKALAGAAASVVGIGLLGATLLAGRGDRAPELAAPATPSGGGNTSTQTGGGLPEPSEIVIVSSPGLATAPGGSRAAGAGGDGLSSGALVPGPTPPVVTDPAPAAAAPAATAPAPPVSPAADPTSGPGVDVAVDVAGTPVAISVGADNTGVQLGELVVGEPAAPGTEAVVDTGGLLPPIDLTPLLRALGLR